MLTLRCRGIGAPAMLTVEIASDIFGASERPLRFAFDGDGDGFSLDLAGLPDDGTLTVDASVFES